MRIIGDYAFGFAKISSIDLSNVESIGGSAFAYSYLQSLDIKDAVLSVGGGAFSGCAYLKTVHIGKGLQVLSDKMFYCCGSLSTIEIPNGILSIGGETFLGSGIETVTFEDNSSLVSIGPSSFAWTPLQEIEIPKSVQVIGGGAFFKDSILNKVIFEEGSALREIGIQAFYQTFSLTGINLPSNLEKIGDYAFQDSGLTGSVNIPAELSSYGPGVFASCHNLTSITVDENNKAYKSIDGVVYTINEKTIVEYPAGNTSTEYTINSNTDTVYDSAFYGSWNLNYVNLPENLVYIQRYAFYDVENLQTMSLPDSVYQISNLAFAKDWNLAYVTFNETSTLPRISYQAFAYSGLQSFRVPSSVSSVDLPDSVKYISNDVFSHCSSLERVKLPKNISEIPVNFCSFCDNLTDITIPDSVVMICSWAFNGCKNLTNIIIPSNVVKIEDKAFYDTGYYNNADNWTDGLLYLSNWLIGADVEKEYLFLDDTVIGICDDVFVECEKLKVLSTPYYGIFDRITNLEILILGSVRVPIAGASLPNSLTLKYIVLKDSVGLDAKDLNFVFGGIAGKSICVESNEKDVRYDENYPGWNNGNKVYYGDKWITVTTYDENDELLSYDIFLTNQVIRLPQILPTITDETTYLLEGWDIDGDGEVDSIPATSTVDITAKAVIKTVQNEYNVTFLDKNGDVISTSILHYGDEITAPAVPVVNGYTFVKWDNYVEGEKVTGNKVITSTWTHDGEGHDYEKYVVNPTCTEEGYDEYVCTICGESYRDNYTDPTGHTYGNWIIDNEPTCTETGMKHRECTCGHIYEEVIPATGHEYVGKVIKAATCEEEGEMEYECTHCHDKVTELIEKTGHHYIKKVVPKWWLQVLIEKILHFFFGYEGDNGYYYLCTECGHLMLEEEYTASAASVESAEECTHTSGAWQHLQGATEDEYGVDVLVCDICGEVLDVKIYGEIPDITYGDVNGDGKVNGKDATRLLQYLAHWDDIVIDERASDVNGDGKVNGKDATRLLQYLAHWDVVLGK